MVVAVVNIAQMGDPGLFYDYVNMLYYMTGCSITFTYYTHLFEIIALLENIFYLLFFFYECTKQTPPVIFTRTDFPQCSRVTVTHVSRLPIRNHKRRADTV